MIAGRIDRPRWLQPRSICLLNRLRQTPSASPIPMQSAPPEQPRIRNFGSSLKRYEKKERRKTQNKSNERDDDVVRVSADLVVSDVLVTNQKGNVILGLQKEDFI